jgi:hypothetical protein
VNACRHRISRGVTQFSVEQNIVDALLRQCLQRVTELKLHVAGCHRPDILRYCVAVGDYYRERETQIEELN